MEFTQNNKESRKNNVNIFIRAARVIERNNRSVTVASLIYRTTYFGVSPKTNAKIKIFSLLMVVFLCYNFQDVGFGTELMI